MKITPHLDTDEVQCRCGCGKGQHPSDLDPILAQLFEDIRLSVARPLNVSSGLRCEDRNRVVGGVPDSAHLRGTALDILAFSGPARFQIVVGAVLAALAQAGIIERHKLFECHEVVSRTLRGIGIASSFVHIDTDHQLPRPSCWRYGDNERR